MKNKLLYVFLILTGTLSAQIVNIPDANFKLLLLQANSTNGIAKNSNGSSMIIDVNSDGNIQVSEALNVYRLSLGGSIISLEGINDFSNLTHLVCGESTLTNLDATMIHDLKVLELNGNSSLTTLNITGLTNLEEVSIAGGQLSQLSTQGCINLKVLYCTGNLITEMDISNSPLLTILECGYNFISILDISNQANLEILSVDHIPTLTEIYMKNNNVDYIYIQTFNNCPNIQLICADENEIPLLVDMFSELSNAPTPFYTTYCTSTPGGNFNTTTGTLKFDSDNNGCDANDALNQFVKINFSNGTETGITYTNSAGIYNFYSQDGSFTITPQMENDWFIVSPQSATVTFADNNNNTQTQDFCITANGMHPDVEVMLVPLGGAQPGFDAVYKVVYKNKGNQLLSGDVTVNFNDTVTDYVSSNPAATAQANILTWNYTSLMPFESREIIFTLNVNSPMETPAVNIDDVLAFTVVVTPATGDETPQDNTFTLDQVVVGSFDPNDITCLEGETVSDNKIGEYLHYNINFENTGTAPATFIVVKDMIDTAKYDVSTLQLLNASHEVMANVTGNKAEFRFDNINLGAQQKGNLVFKIKTLNSLAVNDAVMNKAEIFFDYNFPIVTNEANTTFAALSAGNFVKDATITVYPNPTKGIVNIKANNIIKSIELFDIQGRLLQTGVVNDATTTVDISGKQSGIYFIRIKTDKGIGVEKIIKQ